MGRSRKDVIADLNVALVAAGHTMRSASIELGLNHSYLSKFMRNADYSPEVLPEDVRLALATLLGVDEKIFRIAPQTGIPINEAVGLKEYSKRVVSPIGDSTDRRNVHMRVDHILEELGRIKERLDRIEDQQTAEHTKAGKPNTRPS
jgi:hypothetical protein